MLINRLVSIFSKYSKNTINFEIFIKIVQHLFDIFQKNDEIRVNNPRIAETVGDAIMRKVNSQQCEDALCINCVPGFCRRRPLPPNRNIFQNMTVMGSSNVTNNFRKINLPNGTHFGIENFTAITKDQDIRSLGTNGTLRTATTPLQTGSSLVPGVAPPNGLHRQCTCSWIGI
jgi:hypothetical protein